MHDRELMSLGDEAWRQIYVLRPSATPTAKPKTGEYNHGIVRRRHARVERRLRQ